MVERNTHLLTWLEGGYWSCRYGGQAWAEGYLHNARDVIVDQDARIARLERDLAEARDNASAWHLQCQTVATVLELPEPDGISHAEAVRTKFESLRAELAEARAEAALQSEARDIALTRAKELATEHNAAKKRHEDHLVRLSRSLGGLSRYINEQGDCRSLEDWEAFLLERANQLLHREDDERRRAEAAEAERDRLAADLKRTTRERDKERKHVARLMRDLESARKRAERGEVLASLDLTLVETALAHASFALEGVVAEDDEDMGKDGGSATCQATKKTVDRALSKVRASLQTGEEQG